MKKYYEFFQDHNGDYSMSRLLLFGTWLVASLVMIWLAHLDKMTEGYMTMYLGFPACVFAWTKNQDGKLAAIAAGAPPQAG